MIKLKRFLLPGATLIFSFYLSFLFAIGIIFGYLATHYFHKKLIKKGQVKMILLNFGQWKIHLHHWLIGVLTAFSLYLVGWLHFFPTICLGVLSGLIFHDIYADANWYKVVYRK